MPELSNSARYLVHHTNAPKIVTTIEAAASLWDDEAALIAAEDGGHGSEYLRGQIDTLANAFGLAEEQRPVVIELMVDVHRKRVLAELGAEINAEVDQNFLAGDAHSPGDVAADIVERLIRRYNLAGFNRDDSLENA